MRKAVQNLPKFWISILTILSLLVIDLPVLLAKIDQYNTVLPELLLVSILLIISLLNIIIILYSKLKTLHNKNQFSEAEKCKIKQCLDFVNQKSDVVNTFDFQTFQANLIFLSRIGVVDKKMSNESLEYIKNRQDIGLQNLQKKIFNYRFSRRINYLKKYI